LGEMGSGERMRCVCVPLCCLPCFLARCNSPAKAVTALALGVRDEAWSRVWGEVEEEGPKQVRARKGAASAAF